MKVKKFIRCTAALLLAASVSFSAAALTVSAATPTNGNYITFNSCSSDTTFVDTHREVIAAIADGMLKRESEIDISSYKLKLDNCSAAVSAALATFPEVFFVDRDKMVTNGYSRSSYTSEGEDYVESLIFPYIEVTDSDAERMLAEFYAEADFYLDQVSGELTKCRDEFSIAALLHDEIVLDAQYVLKNSNYNFLVKKQGLCENYSRVYAYLLSQVGIYSEIIDSTSMGHEWMMVRLDGSYYHVDVTWDDSTPDRPGLARHTFFLWSENGIKEIADPDDKHYDFSTINEASDKYDSALFHGYKSKMCKLDADKTQVYAVSGAETGNYLYGKIVKYDYSTNTETDIKIIGDRWVMIDNSSYFYPGSYSGLDTAGGKLFYNTHNEIFMYDPDNNTTETVSTLPSDSGKYYYGVRIRNGKLYGVLAENPSETGTETYVKDLTATVTFDSNGGSSVAAQSVLIGENATVPADPKKPGYKFKGWKLDGSAYDFSTAVTSSIELKADWEKIDSATVVGSSLTLDGRIGVNFYVSMDNGAEDSGIYARMTGPDGEKTQAVSASLVDNNSYKFTYEVAAKEINDDVTIALYDADNNILSLTLSNGITPVVENVYSYKVEDYIESVKNEPDKYESELVELVKAIEDYSTAAAALFGDGSTATSNNDLTAVTAESVRGNKLSITGSTPKGISIAGYSLMLESETSIRLYFKLSDGENAESASKKIKIEGESAVLKSKGDYLYASVDNISASKLDEKITMTIGSNFVAQFSPLSYVFTVLESDASDLSQTNLCNAVRALKIYSDKAKAFFKNRDNQLG